MINDLIGSVKVTVPILLVAAGILCLISSAVGIWWKEIMIDSLARKRLSHLSWFFLISGLILGGAMLFIFNAPFNFPPPMPTPTATSPSATKPIEPTYAGQIPLSSPSIRIIKPSTNGQTTAWIGPVDGTYFTSPG